METVEHVIFTFANSFELKAWDALGETLAVCPQGHWCISEIKQTVLWDEGDSAMHSGGNQASA